MEYIAAVLMFVYLFILGSWMLKKLDSLEISEEPDAEGNGKEEL